MQENKKISITELENIIKEELRTIHEREYEFDDEIEGSEESEKNWGGAGEPDEEFDAAEFFGNAGDAAEDDIRAEFGDDEFAAFGTMEDPRMLKDLDEDEEAESANQMGLFRPQDANGNDIKLKTLVQHIDSDKRGYVIGFGDDGAGNLIVRVDWAWPTDMKFINPNEMGEMQESPENLIVQDAKTKNMNEEFNEEEIADIDSCEEDDETIEEMRSLGSGVKNSGDRNVKLRDDHAHAPLTNLNESIDNSIKSLMSTKVTKKGLQEFISEEAKKVAKQLKG